MRYEVTVDISALPARVWEVMVDVERWHEWTASIARIERLDEGPLRAGSKVRIKQPKFPKATWTVVEVQDGKGFTWTNRAFVLTSTGEHTVAAEGTGSGSRATLVLDQRGLLARPMGWIFGKRMRQYLEYERLGLKQRAESST